MNNRRPPYHPHREKSKAFNNEETLISATMRMKDDNIAGKQDKSKLSKSLRHIFNDMTAIDLRNGESKRTISTNNSNKSNEVEGFDDLVRVSIESEDKLKDYIATLIEAEFPAKNNIPNARELIDVGAAPTKGARYIPGDWVEIEGPDMKWRLDMITRVVKQAPDDFDWNDPENEGKEPNWVYYYHAGIDRKFLEEDIRSPEEGLKRVFGKRPWVWQQWAMLKLEEKIRFQKDHQNDCMEMDIQKYAADLWELWIEHPDNKEFHDVYYDDRVGAFGRNELINHIQKPFHLIDRIKEDKNEWDFSCDGNISAFTYMSLLGAGSLIPYLIFILQIAIPIVLVVQVSSGDVCVEKDDSFQRAKLTALIVLFLYILTVFPDAVYRTIEVEGAVGSVYSRLLSLRRELWIQGDDSVTQMIGYKLDIFMSTAYECILLMLNTYVISASINNPIEVLLDALAFVFVAKIDEEIVKSSWWDPDNRWLTAGAMEVVMAKTVRFRHMASLHIFSEVYDIPIDELRDACDEDRTLLKNLEVAAEDSVNPKYLTKEERVLQLFKEVAKNKNNVNAIDEYEKPAVYFGIIETIMGYFGFASPVFMNFRSFRTWSRWNKVLFLAQVPELDDLFEVDKNGDSVLSYTLADIEPTKETNFANFYPEEEGLSRKQLFFRHLFDVLSNDLSRGLRNSLRRGQDLPFVRIIFHIIDAIVQLFGYLFQVLFPVWLLFMLYDTLDQLLTGECKDTVSDFLRSLFQGSNS